MLHYFCGTQNNVPMEEKIILDSGSSIDLFRNPDFLGDIELRDVPAAIGTNAGSFTVNQQGELKTYGQVPYLPSAVTNLLSLGWITEKYRVTMDSVEDNALYVHTPEKIVRFGRDQNMIYTHVPTPPA